MILVTVVGNTEEEALLMTKLLANTIEHTVSHDGSFNKVSEFSYNIWLDTDKFDLVSLRNITESDDAEA